jgi:hypothetical protein
MSTKVVEVSHKQSGGLNDQHLLFGVLTGDAALFAPLEPEKHEVEVRDEKGNRAVGTGKTHEEARQNAIRNLPADR